CSRGLGSWGGAGASVHSISAYLVFFGWYIAESLSTRGSATLTVPTWYSAARPSRWSTPTPVSNENTVFLPTCGRPMRAIFIGSAVPKAFGTVYAASSFQARAERFDAVEALLDILHRASVAQAHVGIAAEGNAGHHGDLLFIE